MTPERGVDAPIVPAGARRLMAALGVAGAGAFLHGLVLGDAVRAWQALLVNVLFFAGLAQAGVVLSALVQVTSARWARPLKRTAEATAAFLPVSLLLVAVLVAGTRAWAPWVHHPADAQAAWLNVPFFAARELAAFLLLGGLSAAYVYHSVRPDVGMLHESGERPAVGLARRLIAGWRGLDAERDRGQRAQDRLAVAVLIAYVPVFSLVAFDFVMALDPHWFSALLGGYFLTGNLTAGAALLALAATAGRSRLALGGHVGPRQLRDAGTLLFGFSILWAYMLWSQYLVIWYADLPEEIRFIQQRMQGAWAPVTWTVFAAVFAVPFVLLLSRAVKMRPAALASIAGIVLGGIWLERFLLVAPSLRRGEGGAARPAGAARHRRHARPVRPVLRPLPGAVSGAAGIGPEAGTGRSPVGDALTSMIIPSMRVHNGVDPEFEATEDYLRLTLRRRRTEQVMNPLGIFISSVQREFAEERAVLRDYLRGDPLMRRFFDPFLFEDVPATDRRPDELYLDEVERCDLYVGLFGRDYGTEDEQGISPTEREFDRAAALGKQRLIFVKGASDDARHPKMQTLIGRAQAGLIRKRFSTAAELVAGLYSALVEYLDGTDLIRQGPFDASPCMGARLEDLDDERMTTFIRTARGARQFPRPENTTAVALLEHLNLLHKGRPTNAAILLFGKAPQRFLISSQIKCAHFHGTQVAKPIPSHQVYTGTVFELVDHAVDFVLSKIALSVGTRAESIQAPVAYEIPKEVITEAIVNAVAHRDYTSGGSVQVMLFADRLEVWNPGRLPPPLTIEKLRVPHESIPGNPLLARAMYLVKYIEQMGTGTLDMIERCGTAGLKEPEFEAAGEFVIRIRRAALAGQPVVFTDRADVKRNSNATTQETRGGTTREITQETRGTTQETRTTRERILALLSAEPEITRRKLAERIGITADGVKYHLTRLRAAGVIQHVGATKAGRWEVLK